MLSASLNKTFISLSLLYCRTREVCDEPVVRVVRVLVHQRPAHTEEDAEDAGNHRGDVRGAAHGQGGLLHGQLPEGGQAEEDQLKVQVPPRHGGGALLDVRCDPLVRVVALQPHVRARHEGALAHVPAPLAEDRRLRDPPAGEGPVSRGHARLLHGRQAEELHRCVCVYCVIKSGQVRSGQVRVFIV